MKETEFAYRIRQALNEGAERLDYKTVFRLEQARTQALSVHRMSAAENPGWVPAMQTAGGASLDSGSGKFWTWLHRAGLVAPVFALIVGFVGIYQWQRTQSIERTAGVDLALLLDDGPIDTLADSGFGQLLKTQGHAIQRTE